MKSKTKLILTIVVLFILLFPITAIYKDGGTKTYTSLLYKVIIWKNIDSSKSTDFYFFPFNLKTLDSYRKEDKTIYNFIYKTKDNCDNKKDLYFELSDSNIYTYCLDKIEIKTKNTTRDFKTYLNENYINIDYITEKMQITASAWDGGTTIYEKSNSEFIVIPDLTIIKCNTISGNKDIYIMPSNMDIDIAICANHDTFTKTYFIKSIKDKETYYEVTLNQFQGETTMVKIPSEFTNIEIGKNYEFTFYKPSKKIEDSTNSIFENSVLKEINETDIKGLDQIQDVIDTY